MLRKKWPEEFLFSQKLREFFFSVDPNWRAYETKLVHQSKSVAMFSGIRPCD
jgi:hypothetical protein